MPIVAPIQNSLEDVYGLLKFLRHEPWCEASFWRNAITSAIPDKTTGQVVIDGKIVDSSPMKGSNAAPDAMSVAFGRVRRVLAPIILRRTKDTLAEDGYVHLFYDCNSNIIHVSHDYFCQIGNQY